jgi:hypothetical protein
MSKKKQKPDEEFFSYEKEGPPYLSQGRVLVSSEYSQAIEYETGRVFKKSAKRHSSKLPLMDSYLKFR